MPFESAEPPLGPGCRATALSKIVGRMLKMLTRLGARVEDQDSLHVADDGAVHADARLRIESFRLMAASAKVTGARHRESHEYVAPLFGTAR